MQIKRAVGRGSGTRKYDLLTALAVHALAAGKGHERLCLRLISLITARYNWQNDQLSLGQAEIARLWSVDVRTVKREMAALRAKGWLIEKRPAARGRVALHGLGIERILADTRAGWALVGEDLAGRLGEAPGTEPEGGSLEGNVIPFPQGAPLPEGSPWAGVAARLMREEPGLWRAWFAGLEPEVAPEGELWLRAPSGFHATYLRTHLLRRLESAAGPGLKIRISG